MNLDKIVQLEQTLNHALSLLAELKMDTLKGGIPAPEPMVFEEFGRIVYQTMMETYGDERDFTNSTYEALHKVSKGDAETVSVFIKNLARRTKQPDTVGGYCVGVIKKMGIDTIRAEQVQKGERESPKPTLVEELDEQPGWAKEEDPEEASFVTGLISPETAKLVKRTQATLNGSAGE